MTDPRVVRNSIKYKKKAAAKSRFRRSALVLSFIELRDIYKSKPGGRRKKWRALRKLRKEGKEEGRNGGRKEGRQEGRKK
jgi:hypothetical protein